MFDGFLDFDPTLGIYYGLHEYDPLMLEGSKTALEEWVNANQFYQ